MSQKRRSPADEPFFVMRSGSSDVPSGTVIPSHKHEWHQLIYIACGLMAVDTEKGSWIAPSDWAIWVPAHGEHAIRFIGPSSLRTIYIRPDQTGDSPGGCRSLAVSPLLRALILRIVEVGMLDDREKTETAMAALVIAELGRAGPQPFSLAQPTSVICIHAAQLLGTLLPEPTTWQRSQKRSG